MSIYLGNLNTKELVERLGIEEIIYQEDLETMETMRQEKAQIDKGRFHIFDMPFCIVCGGRDAAEKLIGILTPYADCMTAAIQIHVDGTFDDMEEKS